MKIVQIDNFDRDYVSDVLIAENVNEHFGKLIVDFLNSRESVTSERYFVLRQDSYKLKDVLENY